MLPSITKDNWRGVLDAINRQKRTEARFLSDPTELHLLYERIGEVGAPEVLNGFGPESDECGFLLRGWATRNPKEVIAWYEGVPRSNTNILPAHVAEAVAQVDPRAALDFAANEKLPTQSAVVLNIMLAEIQQKGIHGAENFLNEIKDLNNVPQDYKENVFAVIAGRKGMTVGWDNHLTQNLLDWFGPHADQPYVDATSMTRLIYQAADNGRDMTLAWLASNRDRLTPAQQEAAYAGLAQSWVNGDAQSLVTWLQGHPTDPQRDLLATAAAQYRLKYTRTEDLPKWIDLISNPEMKAQLNDAANQLRVGK